ncbi:MAG: FAD-dependent oxidoreductase [Desulfobacteraceae bacterium]|nr:FAD-dependent oxidoreductase [Desulfobacteraceae bacterium]
MTKMIFEPLEIGSMTLKNRIGLAPLLNMPRADDFGPSRDDKTARWFEERAKGGTGLIMTGTVMFLHPLLPDGPERFGKIAEAVHKHGAKLAIQIGAGGVMGGTAPSLPPYPDARHPKLSQFEFFGGSISPMSPTGTVTEFTKEQIEEYINGFAQAAKALKDAGVDAVELHCAHGGATLYCSFISPFYNRREDEYGGNWENRLRFPCETLKKMREAVGPDFPILARIDADELLGETGINVEDAVNFIVPAMEEAGISCFDVSQGSIVHSPEGITIPLYYPRGCYIHNAEAVKKATKLPVIGVGRIVDLDMAEKFLREGKADIIYLGRQLTSDPETVNKYAEGRVDEIRKCIGCVEGCGTPCSINYDISPDAVPLTQAEKKKKILIVGGGVGGMEAARVCALRGHEVILMEKGYELGGTVAALALDPLAAEFKNIVDYLSVQMNKLDIDVRVCKAATAADIEEINPDAVIVATGAHMRMPDVAKDKPGIMDHVEALRNRIAIGQKVVIWGLMYGVELALSLAQEGKDVTLIGEAGEDTLASHASMSRRWWIAKKTVDTHIVKVRPDEQIVRDLRILYHIRVEDITSDGVTITYKDGGKSVLPFDTLIISRGREKNDALFEQIKGEVPEIHKIGDCSAAAHIQQAIQTANEVARKI